jgi:hypothetical protein
MADTTTDTTVKPGYKTTEFWLSLTASVIGFAFASGVFPAESGGDKVLGLAAVVLSSIGYTVSRTVVKK